MIQKFFSETFDLQNLIYENGFWVWIVIIKTHRERRKNIQFIIMFIL